MGVLLLVEWFSALLFLAGAWGFATMALVVPIVLDSKAQSWRFLLASAITLSLVSVGLSAVVLAQQAPRASNLMDALNIVALPGAWLFVGCFVSLALWKYSRQPIAPE
jgi:hypothetical protein